jgi:hypothetical protein
MSRECRKGEVNAFYSKLSHGDKPSRKPFLRQGAIKGRYARTTTPSPSKRVSSTLNTHNTHNTHFNCQRDNEFVNDHCRRSDIPT